MKMKFVNRTWLGFLAIGALVQALGADEMTAYPLIKEGNRYVGEESKDKVGQIRSERSGAGRKLSVKRPFRLLEPVTGDTSTLDRSKMKVDSDKAIQIALKEPMLDKLTIKATELKLVRAGDMFERDNKAPVWRVRLWAAKLRNPNREADIGEVVVAAEDGQVLKTDLHINRVD